MKQIIRPLILISNDDGYTAKGINCLSQMLSDMADIIICAPNSPRSGFSCAFTVEHPLHLRLIEENNNIKKYSCSGTPVDCVKIALDQLCKERQPDLIIGGINHGDNSAMSVHYSGTMGIAIEGCMKGIPSIGFSLCDHKENADFQPLKPYIIDIVTKVLSKGMPKDICLNINFPLIPKYKGIKICRMNKGHWINEFEVRQHPKGGKYYWITGEFHSFEAGTLDADYHALSEGYITITPTKIDITAYEALEEIQDLIS